MKMDDFLYVLFIVGWLAFTIYQQNQKKKRRETQRLASEAHRDFSEEDAGTEEVYDDVPEQPVAQPKAKTHLTDMLEKLLSDDPILETNPADEAQSLEVIPGDTETPAPPQKVFRQDKEATYDENEHQKMKTAYTGDTFSWDDNRENEDEKQENEFFLEEDRNEISQREFYFNLRDAVIYNEILNAKYVN